MSPKYVMVKLGVANSYQLYGIRSVNPDRSERLVDLLNGLALSQLLILIAQEMEGRMRSVQSFEPLDTELKSSCLNRPLTHGKNHTEKPLVLGYKQSHLGVPHRFVGSSSRQPRFRLSMCLTIFIEVDEMNTIPFYVCFLCVSVRS